MSQAARVELSHVGLAAHSRTLLHDITLILEPGSVTALLGRSGAGKTTLLRTVNRLMTPDFGTVSVEGKDLAALSEEQLRTLRHRIGYVIQEAGLFPHRTIEENVALPLELAGEKDRSGPVAEMLRLVGLEPAEFAGRYPHQLSGGQRQRVGLARALVAKPSVLLLDEPFGALDPLTRSEMQTLLRGLLQRFPSTVLLVTHDLPEALALADTVVIVDEGRIAASLRADAVLQSEDLVVHAYREAAGMGERA